MKPQRREGTEHGSQRAGNPGGPKDRIRPSSAPSAPPASAGPQDLPSWREQLNQLAAAERRAGWLAACAERGVFLALTRELVDALARRLRAAPPPVVEVACGAGSLAEALRAAGVELSAADPAAPPGAAVAALDAQTALRRWRPRTVLCAFAPVDSPVERQMLDASSVQHVYLLGARLNGLLGSASLWGRSDWRATPLPDVARWMITRHDVWIPAARGPGRLLAHGEAWLLERAGGPFR